MASTLAVVASGGTVVDPEIVHSLVESRSSGIASLTVREKEVLGRMAAGD